LEDVLVIDDEEEIINVLERNLQSSNFRVTGASSREDAIQSMKEHSYPIVLLDIKFPATSGTEILRELKNINPAVNVFMITGYASHENIMESLGQGAVDYFTKPLDIDRLVDRMEDVRNKVNRWREEIGIE